MSELRRAPAVAGFLAITTLAAACATSSASVTPTVGPSATSASSPPSALASETPSPSVGIAHKTGPRDLLLRVSSSGGFVALEFLAARVPTFSLYGDGTLILATEGGGGALNQPSGAQPPLKRATLDEAQVQAILATALDKGGLAQARDSYLEGGIMDAPSTVYEVHAGGVDKTVRVRGGEVDLSSPGPDTIAMKNFEELGIYLQGIAATAAEGATEYVPDGFAGVLSQLEAGQVPPSKPRKWPWSDLVPKDFAVPAGDAEVALPEHDLARTQVDALGLGDVKGAYTGLTLDGPDGKEYSLILRPLLPDQI